MVDPTDTKLSLDTLLAAARDGAGADRASGDGADFSHGSMSLEAVGPETGADWTEDRRDRLYLVQRGRCEVQRGGSSGSLKAGEALFVSAGDKHRLASPSEDFAAWRIAWGPADGEAPAPDISPFAPIDA